MTDRDLHISEAEFERESRKKAWIFTLVFHICALLPLVFITCSSTGPSDELTQIVGWGGSGGNPDVDAPVGPAPKGNPDAEGSAQSTKVEQTETHQTRTPETPDNPTSETSHSSTEPTSQQQSSSSTSTGSDNSADPKGQPDGTATSPGKGSGGNSVGVGDIGIGRCWSVSPKSAAAGATATQTGRVTLRAVVKWDGTVTGISKVSGSSTLVAKARALLAKARACRATPGTPDVSITVPYNFKFD